MVKLFRADALKQKSKIGGQHFFVFLLLAAFAPAVRGSTVSPAKSSSSCASSEYASAAKNEAQESSTTRSQSEPSLVVVTGGAPLNTTKQVTMGQQLTVCIMGLDNWIYVQKKSPATLRLFIGGAMLESIAPSSVSPSGQEYLNFMLQMDNADSKDWKAWAAIIYASRHSKDNQLPISIAVADTKQVFESNAAVKIVPYPKNWPYLVLVFIALLVGLILLARQTDLLRNSIGVHPAAPLMSPYSLGLFQMAFWFYLVVAAYVYILVSTRQIHIAMGSVLGLLGISSTTGLAAIAVDKQKSSAAQEQRESLLAEQAGLAAHIQNLKSMGVAAGTQGEKDLLEQHSRLAQVNARIAQLPPPPAPPESKGLLEDLLNDGDGVSFHRFQIAIWTIVLGSVFVWEVYRNMSMPDFDPSLLTLMGISAGTYIGFKFPEKPKT